MKEIFLRRSVRSFSDKEIDKEDLLKLAASGHMAPSARNQDSRAFVIVDDKALLERLADVSKYSSFLKEANACIAVIGINKDTITTPHMQLSDLGAATENILLEATHLGIGSCWLGTYPLPDRMNGAKEILGVKDEDFVYSLIALGYPKDSNAFYIKDKVDKKNIYWNRVK